MRAVLGIDDVFLPIDSVLKPSQDQANAASKRSA